MPDQNQHRNIGPFRGLKFAIPISFILWALIVFLLWLILYGCSSYHTDCRIQGFEVFQEGFSSLSSSPDLHEIIELEKVTVHIVGHRKYMKWNRALAHGSRVLGYATSNNEIYLFGKMVDQKIVVNQAVLGHELNHLLNFINPSVADPDKLKDLGL